MGREGGELVWVYLVECRPHTSVLTESRVILKPKSQEKAGNPLRVVASGVVRSGVRSVERTTKVWSGIRKMSMSTRSFGGKAVDAGTLGVCAGGLWRRLVVRCVCETHIGLFDPFLVTSEQLRDITRSS